MRISKGFTILDVPTLMDKIKIIYKARAIDLIKNDPIISEDTSCDHNKIEQVLLISYILKIVKLVIIILNFSYLLAMFWYIMCKLVEDFDNANYKLEKYQ